MQLPSLSQLLLGALILLCTSSVFTQSKTNSSVLSQTIENPRSVIEISPFTILHQKNQEALKVVPKAQFLTLDESITAQISQNRPAKITFNLPYQGGVLILDLVKTEITTQDFSIITERSNSPQMYHGGAHYRGTLRGEAHSSVAISIFEDEIMGGIYTANNGNLVLGKIAERDNINHYVLYDDREMTVKSPFTCATEPSDDPLPHTPHGGAQAEVTKCVRVFLEADNELFIDKGSSVQATVNYLLGMFNQSSVLYANEQITTTVSQIFVWTTPDIYNTTNSATVLDQFKNFRTSFNGDLAHLVGIGGNNLGGIAYVDVLCGSYNVAFSDIATTYSNVPVYSWTVEVFTHEMGHNLGSRHTQWCGWQGGPIDNCVSAEGNCSPGPAPVNGGTIMSYCHLTNYGINFNNGFGSQPGNAIRTSITNAACVPASCPVAACDAPLALTITNITGNGATIGWGTTAGATAYTLRYRVVGAAQWTTINTPANPYTISGLPANDEIEVSVQSLCGSNSSDYKNGMLFVTGASGGSGGGGATCNAPANLSATAGSSSAQTSWNAVSGANSYSIQWKTVNSAVWSTAVSVSGTSYTISNLASSTSYNLRVATVCTNGSSAFTTTSFTTSGGGVSCGAPTNLSVVPAVITATSSWSAVNGALSYTIDWKTSGSSTWNPSVSVASNSYVISGLTAATTYDIRVFTLCNGVNSTYTTASFTTTTATGCGTIPNLTAVPSNNSAQLNWSTVSGASSYKLEWKLSTAATWVNSAIVGTNTYSLTNLVANTGYNIRVAAICASGTSAATLSLFTTATNTATCSAPTNLATVVTPSSCLTSWNAVTGANYYRIQWKTTASSTWSNLVSTVSPSYSIVNLVPSTSYQVRVVTYCSAGVSTYSTSTFTTATSGASCGIPTNLTVSAAANTAQAVWTGVNGANSYTIEWKTATSSAWGSVVGATAPNYAIANLAQGTNYNLRVAAVCNGVVSGYITTSFTTTAGGSCGAPATLNAVAGNTSAATNWTTVSGAASYQIQWKLTSSATWGSLITLNTNSYTISSLAENTAYNFRVRAVCNGIASAYTNGLFTTTTSGGGGSSCNTPSNLVATNVLAVSAGVTWSSVPGVANYSMRIRVQGTLNWFTFTGLPSNQITIQNMTPSTTYEVQTQANCGNNGSSQFSSSLIFTTLALFPEPTMEDRGDIVKLPTHPVGVATVSPNPSTGFARILLDSQEEIPAQITVINSYGQVVSDRSTVISGGSTELDLVNLSNGIYFVRIRLNDNAVQTVRLVKQ